MGIIQQGLLAFCLLTSVTAFATEQAPQHVPDAERRTGENLTERLERTDSVIKPPAVDDGMQVKPPENTAKTPVIKPGEAPTQQFSPSK